MYYYSFFPVICVRTFWAQSLLNLYVMYLFPQSMPSMNGERAALCAGCGGKISDRYYLLAVDKQWHMRCLKCCECKLNLESELTCFSKDGSIYCKDDYYRCIALTFFLNLVWLNFKKPDTHILHHV